MLTQRMRSAALAKELDDLDGGHEGLGRGLVVRGFLHEHADFDLVGALLSVLGDVDLARGLADLDLLGTGYLGEGCGTLGALDLDLGHAGVTDITAARSFLLSVVRFFIRISFLNRAPSGHTFSRKCNVIFFGFYSSVFG